MDTLKADIYERVTNQIIQAIEEGVIKLRMPWHRTGGDTLAPINAVSRLPYRGVNVLCLWAQAEKRGYETGLWATYKQWTDLGGQVNKGEKATIVVFWKFTDADHESSDGEREGDEKRLILARGYPVFNAAQVSGYTPENSEAKTTGERLAHADAFFAALNADIRHGGDRAFYAATSDYIQMPRFEAFCEPVAYYSVLAHEMTHWTGAAHRLNRQLAVRFGSEDRAVEELVAELGAAFLCAGLQLSTEPRPDHAAYVANWLKVLKNDKRAIFTAASKAQAAVDWMRQRQGEERAKAA